MNEQLAIYLWSISDNVRGWCTFFTGVSTLIFIVATLITCSFHDGYHTSDELKEFWSGLKNVSIFTGKMLIISGAISLMLPSKQDLALIFAYPYIKSGVTQVVASPQAKKLNDIGSLYLDKVAKDLQEEIKEK